MANSESNQLSRRERQIMDALYHLNEASVADVRKNMPDPPGYTAVRTMLKILEEKGFVVHREDGRRYVYKPKASAKRVGKSALKRVVDVFFGGSLENALAAHLSDSKATLSPQEVERLRILIEEAQREE